MAKTRSLGIINVGGFGRVEFVKGPDGTIVARKTFSPSPRHGPLTEDQISKLRTRFVREVTVQSSLPQDFVIPILDQDLEVEFPWYTMPVAKTTLREQIRDDKATSNSSQVPLMDILDGLEVLHKYGYVHRDLKPENILLLGGKWRLADFGLALSPAEKITQFSGWGSESYCAPEQRKDFHNVGYAADVYSFGCILHDRFTVDEIRIPYKRQTCSGPIGEVIEKCTEYEPSGRYKSISSLRADLIFALSTQDNIDLDGDEIVDWAPHIATINSWSIDKHLRFARHFAGQDTSRLSDIFVQVDEECIEYLHRFDLNRWSYLMKYYCRWASSAEFEPLYPDVVTRRLELIFKHANFDIQAQANVVTAMAKMGISHRCESAIGCISKLCAPSLPDNLASRIAADIQADNLQHEFRLCLRNSAAGPFHPTIMGVLD